MNKKVLTLCAGALLAGGVSLAYVAPVNAALPAIAAVAADATQAEAPTFEVNTVTKLTSNYTVAENGTLIIDKEGATLDGQNFTLTGHLVIKANNVTVKNLNIKSVTTGSTRYTKTAITVGEDTTNEGEADLTGIVIDNVNITCEASGSFLANGISINTSAEDATCKITNSTITSSNSVGDGWYSVGVIVNAPKSAISAADFFTEESGNTFDDAVVAAVQYAEESGYDYAHLIPDEDNTTGNGLNKYIVSVLNKIKNDGTLAVDAKAEDILAALAKATEEEDVAVSEDAKVAIVASDQNLLFGGATAPDNTNPSNVVLVGDDGKVAADMASAVTSIYGYALQEEATSGEYFMLGFQSKTSNKYFVANSENKVTEFKATDATDPNYLWSVSVSETPTGILKYVFTNKATGKDLVTTGNAGTGKEGEFLPVGNAAYNNGFVLAVGNTELDDATENYWGLYESGEKAFTAEYLNDLEGASFALTITSNKKNPDELLGAEMFDSSIVAEPINGNENTYRFKVGDKYIVLDTKKSWSDQGVRPSGLGYRFTTIDADDLGKSRYVSNFTIYYRAGEKTTVDANGNIVPTAETAIERITVGDYTLSTFNNLDKDYLTVSQAEDLYAKVTFGGSKRADIAELLTSQFVNIQFVNKQYKEDADGDVIVAQKYKKDGAGVLAIEDYDPEYVPAANVLLSSPEAQWAIQYVADGTKGKATFVNRECPEAKVASVTLYETDEKDVYAVAGVGSTSSNVAVQDTIKLTFVKNHTKFDGFKVVDVNALPDTVYNIAAYKAINNVNDAYWVEKNHSTTHQIGLDGDIENAGEWNLHVATKKLVDADGEYVKNAKDEYVYVPDTVFVVSEMSYIDPKTKKVASDFKKDTLAILPYAIQNNDNREFVKYDGTHGVDYYVADKNNKVNPGTETKDGVAPADNFALKMKPDGTYQIISLTTSYPETAWAGENTVVMSGKVYAGSSPAAGILGKTSVYAPRYNDLMLITPVAMPEYRPVVKANEAAFDTVRIYRDENHSQLLYEKKDQKSDISFLNIDNENQFKLADAIFVDTAYVNRGTNTRWQYLLVVQPNNVSEWYCPMQEEHNTEAWREENGVDHCHDAIRKNYVEGRFLVNLMDTANVYETTTQHENPYVNEVEAGVFQAKLAFVPGKHFGDSLVIYKDAAMTEVKDSLYLGDSDFNIAKFAFRYVDNEAGSFKIQTQWKNWKNGDLREETETSNEGYLRWENGTVVVADGYDKGDVFNMTENYTEGNPTANESINAEGAVSVTAVDGAVVIKGAAGKNVVIATILGKVVANETVNSDNETIAVPAGIAVVSVDGESFKVVVK